MCCCSPCLGCVSVPCILWAFGSQAINTSKFRNGLSEFKNMYKSLLKFNYPLGYWDGATCTTFFGFNFWFFSLYHVILLV